MSVESIVLNKIVSDSNISNLEGEYIDESFILYFFDRDIDIFKPDGNILLKFRKKMIDDKLCETGYNSFHMAANRKSYSRGSAAGPVDIDKLPKSVNKLRAMDSSEKGVKNTKNWTYYFKADGSKAKDQISNGVNSNIVGFYEKFRGLPCRMTSFTKNNIDKFITGLPFINAIDKCFKVLMPDKFKNQYNRANTTDFVIEGTSFSTFTINKNFRTSLHKDKGDFKGGFGNLTVLEKGKYSGGYTVFPQYGVGIDVRQGDFLAMDVHEWHANTELNLATKKSERISFICYLRNSIGNIC